MPWDKWSKEGGFGRGGPPCWQVSGCPAEFLFQLQPGCLRSFPSREARRGWDTPPPAPTGCTHPIQTPALSWLWQRGAFRSSVPLPSQATALLRRAAPAITRKLVGTPRTHSRGTRPSPLPSSPIQPIPLHSPNPPVAPCGHWIHQTPALSCRPLPRPHLRPGCSSAGGPQPQARLGLLPLSELPPAPVFSPSLPILACQGQMAPPVGNPLLSWPPRPGLCMPCFRDLSLETVHPP